jgi:hypothetical protein
VASTPIFPPFRRGTLTSALIWLLPLPPLPLRPAAVSALEASNLAKSAAIHNHTHTHPSCHGSIVRKGLCQIELILRPAAVSALPVEASNLARSATSRWTHVCGQPPHQPFFT